MPEHQKPLQFAGILFDVDDTLFNRRVVFDRWLRRYIRETMRVTDELTSSQILEQVQEMHGNGYGSMKELIEKLVVRFSPLEPNGYDAATAYADFFDGIALDREADCVIAHLEAARIPFGIVTNGAERQVEKVEKLGLASRVPCLFVSHTFGSAKPAPDIFVAAAECLGIPPRDILFVGDHPFNDIYGAANAGMHTAWLPNGNEWPIELNPIMPDVTISSLRDIVNLLH